MSGPGAGQGSSQVGSSPRSSPPLSQSDLSERRMSGVTAAEQGAQDGEGPPQKARRIASASEDRPASQAPPASSNNGAASYSNGDARLRRGARACIRCRKQKMRCAMPDNASPTDKCERCTRRRALCEWGPWEAPVPNSRSRPAPSDEQQQEHRPSLPSGTQQQEHQSPRSSKCMIIPALELELDPPSSTLQAASNSLPAFDLAASSNTTTTLPESTTMASAMLSLPCFEELSPFAVHQGAGTSSFGLGSFALSALGNDFGLQFGSSSSSGGMQGLNGMDLSGAFTNGGLGSFGPQTTGEWSQNFFSDVLNDSFFASPMRSDPLNQQQHHSGAGGHQANTSSDEADGNGLIPWSPTSLSSDPASLASEMSMERMKGLFEMYFKFINPCWALLDQMHHTPTFLLQRSPLLALTVVTITSRFSPSSQSLYPLLYQRVRKAASSAMLEGPRTVETVQSCLLLAMWAVQPDPESKSRDWGWLLICHASRLAADLNLHRRKMGQGAATTGQEVFEMLDRQRTYLLCYSLDRSYSLQRGRAPTLSVPPEQLKVIGASCTSLDPRCLITASYAELQSLASIALERVQWLEGDGEMGAVTGEFEKQAKALTRKVREALRETNAMEVIPADQRTFYSDIFDFYVDYWSLVLFSFGLQHAVDKKSTEQAYYSIKCAMLAHNLLDTAISKLSLQPFFKYAPDSRFVFCTYAAVCLIKLKRSGFQQLFPRGSPFSSSAISEQVLELSTRLASTAVDQEHMPLICAGFLRALLKVIDRTEGGAVGGDAEEENSPVIKPLVLSVTQTESWKSMVVPGFEGRERPATGNFLRDVKRESDS